MINLINPDLWQSESLPWGNSLGGEYVVNFQPECVRFYSSERILFLVEKKVNTGWYMDENWRPVNRQRQYRAGWIISNEKFHYGYYEMECKLPNFLNSFPAWWMISVDGCPPEFDIFEQFRKDNKSSRHQVSTTYHWGTNYTTDHYQRGGTLKKCLPIDRSPHLFTFEWLSDRMTTKFDGKVIFELKDLSIMPKLPMNMIVNSGLGDWNPTTDSDFEPFIVTKLNYTAI